MQIIHQAQAMQAWALAQRAQGKSIGFVPTMGYLHEGHLALMRRIRKDVDLLVASIFVNPKQFNVASDLEQYPRNEEGDLACCRAEGVDVVFFPDTEQMYPEPYHTYVEVRGGLAEGLCGATRPGHFLGVTTVVTKLFNLVQPTVSVFGQKDFQQYAIIRRMVEDLNLPVEIIGHPTVREADGLAMSSRNARLTAEDRQRALVIHQTLTWAKAQVDAGERDAKALCDQARERLMAVPHDEIHYVDVREETTLDLLDTLGDGHARLFIAQVFGQVRLIDNLRIFTDPSRPE